MSLSAAVSAVNSLADDGLIDRSPVNSITIDDTDSRPGVDMSKSEHDAPGARHPVRHPRSEHTSITGGRLDLQWRQLQNVEYLTDGGNSWIHTAVFDGKPVVVKTLKPECQDVALAINEIEGELGEHELAETWVDSDIHFVSGYTNLFPPPPRYPRSFEPSQCRYLDWGWPD
jgi:hypothetical protein